MTDIGTTINAWDFVILDLERKRKELDEAISKVREARNIAESANAQICVIDLSKAPVLASILTDGDHTH